MSTESIWNEFSNRLERFILSRVNNTEVAQDILQDVFIKIHLKKESLKDAAKLRSWLFQITKNAIIDYYRKKKIPTAELNEEIDAPIDKELSLEEDEMYQCLEPYVDALPEKYKRALNLTAFQNLSQKELAARENISYSSARSRVQRARKMVKEQIIACCNPTTDIYGNVVEKENCKSSCGCEE